MNIVKNSFFKTTFGGLPAWVFFTVICAPILFWAIPLFTGEALYWGTPALQFIPWRVEGVEQLRQGIIPYNAANVWSPWLQMIKRFFYPRVDYNEIGLIFGSSGTAWDLLCAVLHCSWLL